MTADKKPRRKGAEKIAAEVARLKAKVDAKQKAAALAEIELTEYIAAVKAEMDALKGALPE